MRLLSTIRRLGGAVLLTLAFMQHDARTIQAQVPSRPTDPPKKLALPETDFPAAFTGIPFRSSVAAMGGWGFYRMLLSGDVPPGLTVETGPSVLAIGGIPTLAGQYDFRITAMGVDGMAVSRDYSIRVGSRLARPLDMMPPPFTDMEQFSFSDGTTNVSLPVLVIDLEGFHANDTATNVASALLIVDNEGFHANDGTSYVTLPVLVIDNEGFHANDSATRVTFPYQIADPEAIHFNDNYTPPTIAYQIADPEPIHFNDNYTPPTVAYQISDPEPIHFNDSYTPPTIAYQIADPEPIHFNDSYNVNGPPPAIQTITIGPLPSPVYGGAPFTLTATSSSGLPVTIVSTSSFATGSNPFTPTGSGFATFNAIQAGDANYMPASLAFSVPILPARLIILPAPVSRAFGQPNPTFPFVATGLVNGDTTSVLTGTPQLTTLADPSSPVNGSPYFIDASTGTIAAPNYTINLGGCFCLTITAANSYITFYPIPDMQVYPDPLNPSATSQFPLTARASSGVAVSYLVTGPATLSNTYVNPILTVTGPGLITVTAYTSDPNHNDAVPVVRSFTTQ